MSDGNIRMADVCGVGKITKCEKEGSMKTNPDEPINCNNGNGYWNDEYNYTRAGRGLTKREYFAALILQGMLANPTGIDNRITFAVQYADKLIEELNKPKTDEGNG